MKKRFSDYTFDELLLMSRAQLMRLMEQCKREIRQMLDPLNELSEPSHTDDSSTPNNKKL
jgi:hypothetical protein